MSLHQGHLLRCSITIVIQLSLAMTITKMACSDDRTPDAEFHRRWMASDQTPFSFVYGGRPSSELLRKWNRTVEEKAVDATQMQRVVTWSDPETKLEIRAVLTNYLDTPSVVWTLYITNRGEKDTPILEHLRAVDVTTSVTGDVTLHRSIGSPCRADDWLPLSEAIPVGKRTELAPSDGRSASGESPFFDLQWTGGGVITAVGWSGQWNATIERTSENSLRLRAGMQNMRLALHPGETIRSPKIMQLYWFGDDVWNGYNQFSSCDARSCGAANRRQRGDATNRTLEHIVLRVEQKQRTKRALASRFNQRTWVRDVLARRLLDRSEWFSREHGELRLSDRAGRAERPFSEWPEGNRRCR